MIDRTCSIEQVFLFAHTYTRCGRMFNMFDTLTPMDKALLTTAALAILATAFVIWRRLRQHRKNRED